MSDGTFRCFVSFVAGKEDTSRIPVCVRILTSNLLLFPHLKEQRLCEKGDLVFESTVLAGLLG